MSKGMVNISSKEQFNSLLKSSPIVVADFYADWVEPCQQIDPIYEALSVALSRESLVTFTKINVEEQKDLAEECGIDALPTFLVFKDAKLIDKVEGADVHKLQAVLKKLDAEIKATVESGAASGSSAPWKGAEVPRGYSDITDQLEIRGCELLNADEDAGPVKTLFENTRPSALDKGQGSSAKDWVESGADDQLLLFIPFQSTVKLHTLQFTSLPPQDDEDAPMRPATIRLYINRPQNLDFSEADDTEPTQTIELTSESWNAEGTASVGLRFVKFQKTSSLIVYVQKGDGDGETVRLDRIKLIGEAGTKREMGKLQKVGEDE